MNRLRMISRLLPALLLVLAACGDVRELPTDKIITLYNSNMEKTSRMNMLDTLYVEVGGLKPNALHTVTALDPDDNLIATMTLASDERGVISASPLWYDVGLRKSDFKPDMGGPLSLRAFTIKVTGPGTDYHEPFYIVYSQNNVGKQPKPVIWATSPVSGVSGTWGVENAFDETGTTDATGAVGKTKVYVTGEQIPAVISGVTVSSVDIYIVPSKGAANLWQDGETLTDKFVVRKLNVSVTSDGAGAMKLAPTLVWDLNSGPTLVNPGEKNCSYDVIVDVDRDGVFDIGADVNADGALDDYVDGIDGQGVVGFVVMNTPANDFFVTITDNAGNKTNAVNDSGDGLKIAMENIPAGSTSVTLNLYQHLTTTPSIAPLSLTVTSATGTHYMPYVASTAFVSTVTTTNPLYPIGVANGATQAYDLVITGIGSTPYTTTIRVMHPSPTLITSNGTIDTTTFDETGTAGGSTSVYLRTAGLGLATGTKTVYVMPTRAAGWASTTMLSGYTISKSVEILGTGNIALNTLLWDLNAGPTLLNPTSANNAYDIIIDTDNDGTFDPALDIVSSQPAFVVKDTVSNVLPDVTFLNIASGGVFSGTNYDYRDAFAKDGKDTLNTGYVSYGIKAIWNPYIRYSKYTTSPNPSLYYGTNVDVYVVDATKAKLSNFATAVLGQGDFADVAGGKKSLPVQPSCQNGAGQQNIWVPNFTTGKYYVIVDVDSDGKITERVDIIDAVKSDGTTIKDDAGVVGFSVN